MKFLLKKYLLVVIVFFISANAFATKMAPVSLEELLTDSSIVAIVNIKQASVSTSQYEVIHSGEQKYYLDYIATIIDSVKGGDAGKTIKFMSREPLLISREYLVFLNSTKSGELHVAQAGFAAFEKAYISVKAGIKECLRIPSDFISLPKELVIIHGITKLNEQSSYVWSEWLPFKKWQIRHLNVPFPENQRGQ